MWLLLWLFITLNHFKWHFFAVTVAMSNDKVQWLFLFRWMSHDFSLSIFSHILRYKSSPWVTVTMSNDYVQNFTTSFRNLLPRANSAYVSVTDKSTITPAYSLTIIQDCTFSPIYLLSLPFAWNLWRIATPEQQGLHMQPRFRVKAVLTQNSDGFFLPSILKNFSTAAALASRTLWYANALWRLFNCECNTVLLMSTLWLSPNI